MFSILTVQVYNNDWFGNAGLGFTITISWQYIFTMRELFSWLVVGATHAE